MDEERLETAEGGTEDGGFLDGWEKTGEGAAEEAAGNGEPKTAAGERAPEAPEDGAETAGGEDGNVESGQGGGETAQQRTWRLEGPDGQTVKPEAREAALAAREAKARAEQEAAQRQAEERRNWEVRRDADIQTFAQVFPEAAADPKTIPKEVWEAVGGGLSLTAAYAACVRHQQEQAAQTEARRRQQAAENAARSTGTMRSAGSGAAGKDPFLEGWENP